MLCATVVVIENKIGNPSSNSGWSCLIHVNSLGKGINSKQPTISVQSCNNFYYLRVQKQLNMVHANLILPFLAAEVSKLKADFVSEGLKLNPVPPKIEDGWVPAKGVLVVLLDEKIELGTELIVQGLAVEVLVERAAELVVVVWEAGLVMLLSALVVTVVVSVDEGVAEKKEEEK